MHLMWLERTPILHVVDTLTGFQNATVLREKRAEDVRNSFVKCLATLYIVYPNIIVLDQEAGFTAKSFRDLATANGIILQFSGAHSHNSIGAGEKYQKLIRRVFRCLRAKHPKLEPKVTLRYSAKRLKNTTVSEGHMSPLLVFGSMPTFPIPNNNISGQAE